MAKKKNTNNKKKKGLKSPTSILAKKAASSTANYAKNNVQTLLVLSAVAIGGYALYKALTAVNKVGEVAGGIFEPGSSSPGGNTTGSGAGNSTPTITPNQASTIARILLTAMDGFGTDEQAIYNVLRGKTPADFHLISEAFGTPRYDGAGEGVWPASKRNLTDWLTRELSLSEMNELKKIIPGVF